jgi:ketosteroid isomerase-like protein
MRRIGVDWGPACPGATRRWPGQLTPPHRATAPAHRYDPAMDRELLAANEAFYQAFRSEDMPAMEALWAEHAPVFCIHPGWSALLGRDAVLGSWRAIIESGAPPIHCEEPRVQLLGEVGCVICIERVGSTRLVATNLFIREDGRWRMVHHHAGQISDHDDDEDTSYVGLN